MHCLGLLVCGFGKKKAERNLEGERSVLLAVVEAV
jgi:hypothetical protein